MAFDEASNFHATGTFNHKVFGVAEVTDQPEYDRLKARGCREISKEEFEEELKKKSGNQPLSEPLLPVSEASRAQLAAGRDQNPSIDSVKAAVPVPKARRSTE